jgi:GNAT superfamily N-acetyltransferase
MLQDLVIKPLVPSLKEDFLQFFDNKCIFADEDWAGCYCTFYHDDAGEFGKLSGRREYARMLIEKGILKGYLAYKDSKVVGWCNANNKSVYTHLPGDIAINDDTEDSNTIKSIVCFTIDPEMRRQGIATKLLEYACRELEGSDISCIEAYPDIKQSFNNGEYHGTYSMFEKAGFKEYKTYNDFMIMRKYRNSAN